MPLLNMIDVSDNNGSLNEQFFQQLVQLGVQTIAIKCAEYYNGGMQEDPCFANSWGLARQHGLRRIAYLLCHPNIDILTQANFATQVAKNRGYSPGEDKMCADIEIPGYDVPSARTMLTQIDKCIGQALGTTVFYSYSSYIKSLLNDGNGLGQWPLWLADTGVPQPTKPPGWSLISYWQWGQQLVAGKTLDCNTDYTKTPQQVLTEDDVAFLTEYNNDYWVVSVDLTTRKKVASPADGSVLTAAGYKIVPLTPAQMAGIAVVA